MDICDLFLSLTLTPGVPHPTGIGFGMRIRIGHPECFRYEAVGYVRIDIPDSETMESDDADNFLYAKVPPNIPVTLQSFLDFLCTGVELPKFLGEHGFPEGFEVSYAKSDIVIPQLGLFIPGGFIFNGTLSWFGVKVSANIYVNLPDVVQVRAELFPMTLAGGLLKMYKSQSDKQKGPFLSILMRTKPLPAFKAEAAGYVSVLGIEAEVSLFFNPAGYEIYLHGKIFNVIEASLRVYAITGSVYNAEWGVEANLTVSLFRAIEDGVVGILQGAADVADAAISGAQERIKKAEDAFNILNNALRSAEKAVRKAKQTVRDLRNEVHDLRNTLHSICQFRECGEICVPILCPCGCAVRVWGKCVVPCLEWNSCCFKIPDILCHLYNAV